MKIWEVDFINGGRLIVFADTRLEIWNKYSGVRKIHQVVIHQGDIMYRVVWVSPENPNEIEEWYEDDIPTIEQAIGYRDVAAKEAKTINDGLDWYPRIQKAEYTFVD